MKQRQMELGFLGFGEAATAFTTGWRNAGFTGAIFAYDVIDKAAECRALSVTPVSNPSVLHEKAQLIISAVTPDQQLNAARSISALSPGQIYLDINSVAPKRKQLAGQLLGSGYIDAAVLAPVYPKLNQAPMIVSGDQAQAQEQALLSFFPNVAVVSQNIGDASLTKMIRSVFVKGIEAVVTECALAAYQTGIAEAVFPTLDKTIQDKTALQLTDYSMERVAVHGKRRSAEMREVSDTLADLNLPNSMSQASAELQSLIGSMNLVNITESAEQISANVLRHLQQKNSSEED